MLLNWPFGSDHGKVTPTVHSVLLNTLIFFFDTVTVQRWFLMPLLLAYAPAVACPSADCSSPMKCEPKWNFSDHAEYAFAGSIRV